MDSEMGIRFYCPNGHRLHVKSFLAGKRGICPHCSARFRIPPESEIPRGSPKINPNLKAAASDESEEAEPEEAAAGEAAVGDSVERLLSAAAAATTARDAPPETPPAWQPSPGVDPIMEAPEAVWYVRPPSGGQYGPAKGEVMRRWVAEGRVSADSLVWREGWSDWVAAGPVFPKLNANYNANYTASDAPASAAYPAKRELVSVQLQAVATESRNGAHPAAASARAVTQQKSLAPVIILVLTAIALVVILVFVLTTKQ
jgi:hypothetical protein